MWSSKVVIHPWVGERYENPKYFKEKTLILGESNFTQPENFNKNLVIRCIEDDINIHGENRDTTGFCRFSTKIRRVVFGRDECIGPKGLWSDVSFYNFIQSLVGEKSRVRPTQEMWHSSTPAFTEVIETLQPKIILVLGKQNWQNLINNLQIVPKDEYSSTLKYGNLSVKIGYIKHPSSNLAYDDWSPIAQRLLLN